MEAVKHREKLVARARQIVGDNAEDVVSDLMEYLLKGRFNSPKDPLPMLMWYVKNRSIDFKRKKHIELRGYLEYTMAQDQEISGDEIEGLEESLKKLPAFICRIIILHYCEGMTLPELEKRTGIKFNRLRYLISLGTTQIRNDQEARTN